MSVNKINGKRALKEQTQKMLKAYPPIRPLKGCKPDKAKYSLYFSHLLTTHLLSDTQFGHDITSTLFIITKIAAETSALNTRRTK